MCLMVRHHLENNMCASYSINIRERTSMFPFSLYSLTAQHNIHLDFSTRRFGFCFCCFNIPSSSLREATSSHRTSPAKRFLLDKKTFITFYREGEAKKALTLCLCKNLGDLSANLAIIWRKINRIRSTQVQINKKNLTNTSKV
jgi:hypothetical protein